MQTFMSHANFLVVYPKDRLFGPLITRVTVSYPAFYHIWYRGWGRVGVSLGWSITPRDWEMEPQGWVGVSPGW